jgi:hypothetical protein
MTDQIDKIKNQLLQDAFNRHPGQKLEPMPKLKTLEDGFDIVDFLGIVKFEYHVPGDPSSKCLARHIHDGSIFCDS